MQGKKNPAEPFELTDYIPHGALVLRFAMVNNPFATYDIKDVLDGENASRQGKSGALEINEVSYSWAHEMPIGELARFPQKGFKNVMSVLLSTDFDSLDENTQLNYLEIGDTAKMLDRIDCATNNGAKFFVSSGNLGKEYFNFVLLANGAQGVGSLNLEGKISDFSSSRKSDLTQHYELGEYEIVRTKDGFNYTGGDWTDAVCDFDELFQGKNYDKKLCGTSFCAPIRAARYALNRAMEGVL